MVITDALNGEVTGNITAIESLHCHLRELSAEDYFVPRPNLRVVVQGNTATQGEMVATIENVSVLVG